MAQEHRRLSRGGRGEGPEAVVPLNENLGSQSSPDVLVRKIAVKNFIFLICSKYVSLQIYDQIYEAQQIKTPVTKTILGEVHKKLLRLYLALSLVSATFERTFSALRRTVKTMKNDHLNNCLLQHCCKPIKGTLNTAQMSQRSLFVQTNNAKNLGKYE